MIPFIGIDIIKNGTELETCVYRQPTNTGLLLHFQSHATNVTKPVYWRPCTITPMSCHLRQKPSIRNVPNYVPSSATLISNWPHPASILPLMSEKKTDDGNTIRIVLPFKDQIAANSVHTRQLRDLNNKTDVTSQPIFVSKELEQGLKSEEIKPSIVSHQCVVYKFACDLCDAVKLATHWPDTFINALPNTSIQLSVNIFWKRTVTKIFSMRVNFAFSRNATGNMTASVYEMLFIKELRT